MNKQFSLTELWLVKGGKDKSFIGSIKRNKENNEIYGNVLINGFKILVSGDSENEISQKFDEMCYLKLNNLI